MNKKYILVGLAVVALLVFVILLIFFPRKKPETVNLNLVTSMEDQKNLADYISAFETANNAKINFQKLPAKNYELDSLNLLSTGQIDIWGIPHNWLPKQHNKLVPLSGYANTLPQAYPPVVKDDAIDNQIYGLPLSLDALVLFANDDLRPARPNLSEEENNIKSSQANDWETLALKSRLLTAKSGNQITQAGAALGTANLAAAPDILTALMLQYGTQMTNSARTEATFHTGLNVFGGAAFPGAAALEYFTSFADPTNLNYSFSEALGDPLEAFANGKVAYYIDYASVEKDIKRLNPRLNFEVKALPQVKATENPVNYVSYETFTVPTTSKNQDLAWKFIEGFTNKDSMRRYQELSKKTPALTELAGTGSPVTDAIATAKSWYMPDATEVDRIFREVIRQVVGGQKAQTALEGAAQEVTTLLGGIK